MNFISLYNVPDVKVNFNYLQENEMLLQKHGKIRTVYTFKNIWIMSVSKPNTSIGIKMIDKQYL